MTTPHLSICLPVYNFGSFLGETLDSILPQAGPEVEVVVVDGASTDDTADVVARVRERWPALRYVRLDRRGGIDVDMVLSVDQAQADYCWLFSGDDIMRPGAVARVLEVIGSGDDVYICRHTICDKEMRFLADYPILPGQGMRRFDVAERAERQSFLRSAVNTEALFSFMSGLVIRRQAWQSVPMGTQFTSRCWGHVERLLTLGAKGLKVCYVGEIWLDKRGDNDSFLEHGIVNRIGIAVDGYMRLAAAFFGPDSVEAAQVRRYLRNEINMATFMVARQACASDPDRESRAELDRMMDALYCDPSAWNWLTRAMYHGFPLWLYAWVAVCWRAIRPLVTRRELLSMR
jgi:abequosyltransferase